ncbi:Zinc finger, ring/fyve/phd-type, partial [Globisporangium splendens]
MYASPPDEMRSGSARNREPSPFTGPPVSGSERRMVNGTFTSPWTPSGERTDPARAAAVAAVKAANNKKKAAQEAENPFRLPPLSKSEMAYMVRKAKESSIALVDHAHTLDGPVEWQYTGKFRGIQMYRGEGTAMDASNSGMEYMCGVTTMMGTLDEVSGYFDQMTTEKMRAKKADDVLDCAVLYAIEAGDKKNPHYRVAVKYTSFEGPSTFSRARDYVYLECQDTFRHASGRRGWVLSMHSIKLPNCPEMDGTVRGSMYHSGYVFVEAEKPGYMDVMHSLQINFKATKRLPSFMLNSALKRRITSVIKVSREIQMARMGQQTLLKKQDLMPKKSSSLCSNCSRKFTLFIRKTRCRMCGQVVCQSCAPQVDWETQGEGTKKTRICMKCYRTGGTNLAPSSSTGTAKNSAEYSDDEDLAEEEEAHAAHEEDEEEGGEDGLEEQTEVSVFAQSRFTRATADSLFSFSSGFHIHDLSASQVGKSKNYAAESYDQSVQGSHFDPNASATSNFYDTKLFLTPEDTDEELDKRARRYDPDFRDTSIAEHPDVEADADGRAPPPPPPPQFQLNANSLKEHNMRFKQEKEVVPPPPHQNPLPPMVSQKSGKLVSIKDIRSNFMKGTVKEDIRGPEPQAAPSYAFQNEDDYYSHPPSAILNQVRANRSRTIQFAPEGDYRSPEMMASMEEEHKKRMEELNKATSTYANYRITEPKAPEGERLTIEELEKAESPKFTALPDDYETERNNDLSPRETDTQDSDTDADEYYRPNPLELSQVRANRSRTIEFMPHFMQTDEDDASDREDEEPHSVAQQQQEVQLSVQQGATLRQSAEMGQNLSEDNSKLIQSEALPIEESVPQPPTPEHDTPSRFSQTMIPILDYTATERTSETQPSESVVEVKARGSRILSDIPILDYDRSTTGSVRDSDFDEELMNRPTAVIMEQVRANRTRSMQYEESNDGFRSTEIMHNIEEEHKKRMAELNRIAMDYTGNRISKLHFVDEDRESLDTVDYERMSGSYRKTSQHLDILDEDGIDAERPSEIPPQTPSPRQSRRTTGTSRMTDLQFSLNDSPLRSRDGNSSSRMSDLEFGRVSAPRYSHETSNQSTSRMTDLEFAHISSPKASADTRMTDLQFMPDDTLFKKPAGGSKTHLEFTLDLLEPRDTIDERLSSPRDSTVFDEEVVGRSTAVIMDQVRANRERVPKDLDIPESDIRSTAIMKDIEAEHHKRMADLNRIAMENVGGRISSFPARESEMSNADDHIAIKQINNSHVDAGWRSTTIMDRYQNSHEAKMKALREKVRQLDEECRASLATIFSPDELDFTDIESEDKAAETAAAKPKYKHRDVNEITKSDGEDAYGNENNSRIANLYSVKKLRPVAARKNPILMNERVSSHTLYQQIAQLTQLQSQMAMAKDTEDEEAFKAQIKEQYQVLRTLKLRGW